ncbi:MAG TPA: T9SS type A sorting domain-containing protein [Bacteroides sp.]|nr:T9SS type A sorting domain-containing protein [Bacteroides sp.]
MSVFVSWQFGFVFGMDSAHRTIRNEEGLIRYFSLFSGIFVYVTESKLKEMHNAGFHVRCCLAILAFCIPASLFCQVKIFSSDSVNLGDWYDGQRKIIRSPDPYIVIESGDKIFLSRDLGEAKEILRGGKASLAVDPLSNVFVVYVYQGIRIAFETEPGIWSPGRLISDTAESVSFPVADCDGSGNIHVIYGITDTTVRGDRFLSALKYVKLDQDSVIHASVIYKTDRWTHPDTLVHYHLATHLTSADDAVFVAYQLSSDSINLGFSANGGAEWREAVSFPGTRPTLSIGPGYYYPDIIESETFPVVLYIDLEGNLANGLAYYSMGHFDWMGTRIIHPGPVETASADDVISPARYSLIFRKEGALFHAYTEFFGDCQVLDTVAEQALASSIAYKQFNQEKVDIVWIEQNSGIHELYYRWFSKVPSGISGHPGPGGLSLDVDPNPFERNVRLIIRVPGYHRVVDLRIYDLHGREVKRFEVIDHTDQSEIHWDGSSGDGASLKDGLYLIRVTSGNFSAIKRIVRTGS